MLSFAVVEVDDPKKLKFVMGVKSFLVIFFIFFLTVEAVSQSSNPGEVSRKNILAATGLLNQNLKGNEEIIRVWYYSYAQEKGWVLNLTKDETNNWTVIKCNFYPSKAGSDTDIGYDKTQLNLVESGQIIDDLNVKKVLKRLQTQEREIKKYKKQIDGDYVIADGVTSTIEWFDNKKRVYRTYSNTDRLIEFYRQSGVELTNHISFRQIFTKFLTLTGVSKVSL